MDEENKSNPYDEVKERSYLLIILQHMENLMGRQFQNADFYLFSSLRFIPSPIQVRLPERVISLFGQNLSAKNQ